MNKSAPFCSAEDPWLRRISYCGHRSYGPQRSNRPDRPHGSQRSDWSDRSNGANRSDRSYRFRRRGRGSRSDWNSGDHPGGNRNYG